jgi:septal ring factor EnvC (AmiA/AmiB activator)
MDSSVIGSLIAGSVAVVGPYLVYRINRRTATTDAAQKQIDQIQEDREADRKQFNETAARFDARQQRVEQRLESAESLLRISSDYILALRFHIASGKPPTAAPFPAEMTQGMPGDR